MFEYGMYGFVSIARLIIVILYTMSILMILIVNTIQVGE